MYVSLNQDIAITSDNGVNMLKATSLLSKYIAKYNEEDQLLDNSLDNSMKNRSKKLLDNEILKSCLYLDPRFQHTLTATDKELAIKYLKKFGIGM